MSEADEEKMRELISQAIPPIADCELKRELWPQMARRLQERSAPVPWFDWVLVALLATWFAVFPQAVLVVLYHL
jgi:hypothetical protein